MSFAQIVRIHSCIMSIVRKNISLVVLFFGTALVIVSAILFWPTGVETEKTEPTKKGETVGKAPLKKPTTGKKPTKKGDSAEKVTTASNHPRPLFDLDDADEKALTEAQKRLLEELRALSDAEDKKGLYKLISRMQKSDEWPDGIPSILHEEAIEALQWIGSDALPDLFGYLECGDESIREQAMDALQEMLCDPDKSDYDRSAMLKSVLPYLNTMTDVDALDDIFSDIMEMRNSVKGSTLCYLLDNGSPTVQSALADTIEMVTGEEGYTTSKQIQDWMKDPENADDPDDDEFYGGITDDDDDDATDAKKIENDGDFK